MKRTALIAFFAAAIGTGIFFACGSESEDPGDDKNPDTVQNDTISGDTDVDPVDPQDTDADSTNTSDDTPPIDGGDIAPDVDTDIDDAADVTEEPPAEDAQ